MLETDIIWLKKTNHQADFWRNKQVNVKMQILAVLVRERDDYQVPHSHPAVGGRVRINECRASSELILFSLSCAALNFSEHTVLLCGKYEASSSVWIARVLLFLHVFSDDGEPYSVLFSWVLIMSRTACSYLVGTSGRWRNSMRCIIC